MLSLHTRSFLRMIRKDWEIYTLQFVTLSIAFATAILFISFALNELGGGSSFYDRGKYGEPYCVLILTCISALIILLAATNFVNLVSLTLPARAKELAMRKVAGANRSPLLGLLAKENFAIAGISLVIAIAILAAARSYIHNWIDGFSVAAVLILILLLIAIAIAPLIPAWAFVKASPGKLLGTDTITFPRMKNVITFIQLGVSMSLIIASLVIDRQISRSLIREPGKNHDQVVYTKWPEGMSRQYLNRLKNDWPRNNPNIVELTAVSHTPDNLTSKNIGDDHYRLNVDPDFKDFLDLEMAQGRWFGVNDGDSVIVNEGFVDGDPKTMGVLKNFGDKPVRITVSSGEFNFIMIRILEVDIRTTLKTIERSFTEISGRPAVISFLNKNYVEILAYEDRLNRMSDLLSVVGLLMACCAIYALSLSRMKDNLKQIAIRKTFGASNGQIVGRLSLQFLELMLGSLFFFGPITYFLLREWLRNFAYSARFVWADPFIAIVVCLAIVLITNLLMLTRINSGSLKDLLRR